MKNIIQNITTYSLRLFLLAVMLTGFLAVSSTPALSAKPNHQFVTIEFDDQAFDLEMGTIHVCVSSGCGFDFIIYPDLDFLIGYSSDTIPHATLLINRQSDVQIAYSDETYKKVKYNDLDTLTFTPSKIRTDKQSQE